MAPRLSVYLAGPEVFLPDGRELIEAKGAILRAHGLEPVSLPAEMGTLPAGTPWTVGVEISRRNEELVKRAGACIANLTPFRGVSADVGTVYELSFAAALGKKIAAYSNDPRPYRDRVKFDAYGGENPYRCQGKLWAPDRTMVEDHGMRDNLMLHAGLESRGATFHSPQTAPEDAWRHLGTFTAAVAELAGRGPTGG